MSRSFEHLLNALLCPPDAVCFSQQSRTNENGVAKPLELRQAQSSRNRGRENLQHPMRNKSRRRLPSERAMQAVELPRVALHKLALHSPAIYRAAMKPVILLAFLPNSHVTSGRCIERLNDWQQPWSLASQAAADAVGLLQLAAHVRSDTVADYARERLLYAVARMQEDMANTQMRVEAVSATAQALMLSEVYHATSSSSFNFSKHLQGVQAASALSELHVLPLSRFGQFLSRCLNSFTVLHAIVTRSESDLTDLLDIATHGLGTPRLTETLLRLASEVPAVLHAGDEVICSNLAANPTEALEADLDRLLLALTSWMSDSIAVGDLSTPYSTPVIYGSYHDALHAIPMDTVFDSSLGFENVEQALCFTLCWICALQIQEVKYELALRRWNCSEPTVVDAREMIDRYASFLCQSLGYFFDAADGTVCRALLSRAPLHFAQKAFCTIGKLDKAMWCHSVESNIRSSVDYLRWDMLLSFGLFTLPWIT